MRSRTSFGALLLLLLTPALVTAAVQTTIVVDGGSTDWAFLPETGTPTGYFTVGPGTPPAGSGSAFLQTDETADGIALFSQELIGTRLADFTVLSYWTYTSSPPQAAALQFSVDYDDTDGDLSWQGRLVFEPSNAGTVLADTWQQWDTLAGDWWATGEPGKTTCPQSSPCTWTEVLAAFPDAAIHGPTLGQFLVKSGSGWSGTIDTHTDAIEVVTGAVNVLYDFESTSNRINTSALSENGWYSDDTRADGTSTMPEAVGTNLVSPTLTDDPEGSSVDATADHDDDILNQITFELFGPPVPPPVDEWQGAVHLTIDASAGAAGKSQISHRNNPAVTMDADGFGLGYEVLTATFLARYSWMADNLGNPGITGALKLGFITTEYPGPDMSPRTGEDAWDKLLVYEPSNGNGGSADGTWQTEAINFTTGKWWIVDRGAVSTGSTQGSPMTLSDMTSSAVMIGGRPVSAIWALLTDADPGEEAILTSIQFGIGSNNPGGSVYLNQLETSFYRPGMVTTFGIDPASSTVLCVPSSFDAQCEAVEATIQEALGTTNLGPEDIILVDAGTYNEILTVPTGVMLRGSRAGESGCDRIGSETVLAGPMTILASDVVVDGFSFEGPGVKITTGATVDDLVLRNNRFVGGLEQVRIESLFGGDDITLEDNELTGGVALFRSVPAGQLVVRDDAPGLYVRRNCFENASVAGIRFDAGATAASSSVRSAVIGDNVFAATAGGIDLSTGAADGARISGNRFLGQTARAIQGQLVDSTVIDNLFDGGSSDGIFLSESATASPPANASTGNLVVLNCFHQNLGSGLAFSSTQATGTIATNAAGFNDFVGNGAGVSYSGAEVIDVESNYWNAADGPSGDAPGGGDSLLGPSLDYQPFSPVPVTFATPCSPNADLTIAKVDDQPDAYATVGDPVTYTVTVGNLGPFDATNAHVFDPVPAGLIGCTWTCQSAGGASCGAAAGAGTLSEAVDIPVSGTVTFEMTCTYDPSPGTYAATNVAIVSAGDQADSNTTNNTASVRTSNDGLFADGFESGDTLTWDGALP